MGEKRFSQKDEDDWEILDRNEHFAYAHSGCQAEKIIHELNELVETNRELYKENKQLKNKEKQQYTNLLECIYWLIKLHKENEELKSENELLKQDMEHCANQFKDDGKNVLLGLKRFEMTEKDKSCGHCKNLQIDGMFGMWCDKGRNWKNTDANYCSDYER